MKHLTHIGALVLLAGIPLTTHAQSAPQTAIAQPAGRFIPMDGGRNFRDIGGYRTADGHVVRWGMLYRSGSPGGLSALGQAQLAQMHITGIIDLRSTGERAGDKNKGLTALPGYWTRDYTLDMGGLAAKFANPANRTPEAAKEIMRQGYVTLHREQAASYRELFARLLHANGPIMVNCTAGKDRTGVASALVLTALGVPYDTVRGDYLLSNNPESMASLSKAMGLQTGGAPGDVVKVIAGVDGTYLDTSFAAIRQEYGSVNGYLAKELGVGARDIAYLRRKMLSRN
ncbi:MAG: hypothetical protein RLY97_1346 [Pseudomonadota bacterium]|jgi:protein-tyrosine phosphatase